MSGGRLRAGSELRARVLVALVGVPLVLGAAWAGGWPLGLLLAAVAAIGAGEFHRLAASSSSGGHPLRWLGIPAAALLVALAAHDPTFATWADRAVVVLLLLGLASFAASVVSPGVEQALLSAASTVSGALYTGGTLSFALLLRHLPEAGGSPAAASAGLILLLVPLLATWAGDTAAYFGGRRFGRRRLAPRVSPGKTVEGGLAGLAGSALAGVALGLYAESSGAVGLAASEGAVIGLVLGAAGQLGDLAESRLKREAGVKDSGGLLPGHGGVLDRFDALFFAIPLAYWLVATLGIAP